MKCGTHNEDIFEHLYDYYDWGSFNAEYNEKVDALLEKKHELDLKGNVWKYKCSRCGEVRI